MHKLHPEKLSLRLSEVPFAGHNLSARVLKAMICTIYSMPAQTDLQCLKRFLGMVNLLRPFVQNLSSKANILRQLTKTDTEWLGSAEQQKAVDNIFAD